MTLRSALLRRWWMGPFYPFLNEILIIYNLYLEDICKSSQVSIKLLFLALSVRSLHKFWQKQLI